MNSILRNILAVLAGLLIGGVVNMSIVMISSSLIPPPEGADVTTMEGLKESLHLFEPRHFIMPFLAHALGTFVGAMVTALMAANNKIKLAMVIGLFFLIGGLANVMMLPSPVWFTILDLGGAYIPMSFLGGRVGSRKRGINEI
jgi:hypothetical protein